MKKTLTLVSTLALCGLLSGCAAVVASSAASGIMMAQDRRTAGTIVEDNSIELKAKNAITAALSEEEKANISVISYNNNVLLIGQSSTADIRHRAEQAVKDVAKVGAVHNSINVAAPVSLSVKANDSWITTKVKSEMLVTPDFNPTRVKVVTENGIVYLIGIVTPREENIVVDIARNTKGVKRVVKVFEYLPS